MPWADADTPDIDSSHLRLRATANERGSSPIDQTISIPIVNGQGMYSMPKKTTFRVTITGTGVVCAPARGTWNLTVVDVVARKVVFEGQDLAVHQPVRFSYKTSFSAQLEAYADWSEGGDTTLQLRIVAGF